MCKKFLAVFCLVLTIPVLYNCRGGGKDVSREAEKSAELAAVQDAAAQNTAVQNTAASVSAAQDAGTAARQNTGANAANSAAAGVGAGAVPAGQRTDSAGGESLASLSTVRNRSGRGVFVGELNPVNYKTVDPAVLIQMGMEQYQVSFILGERHLNDRNYEKALAEYNKAIILKPDYAEALFSRGRTYQIKGDLNRSGGAF